MSVFTLSIGPSYSSSYRFSSGLFRYKSTLNLDLLCTVVVFLVYMVLLRVVSLTSHVRCLKCIIFQYSVDCAEITGTRPR